MSIAALADTRIQRTEAATPTTDAPVTRAGIPAGVLNTLVQWVPTETVVGYVAIQAAMEPLTPTAGQKLCRLEFTDRWVLFAIMLVLSVVLVPIYTRIKANNCSTPFQWPVLEMAISGFAFVLWAIALADSPFDDLCGFKEWHAVAAIVVGGALLGGLTLA